MTGFTTLKCPVSTTTNTSEVWGKMICGVVKKVDIAPNTELEVGCGLEKGDDHGNVHLTAQVVDGLKIVYTWSVEDEGN